MITRKALSADEYLASQPLPVSKNLAKLRSIIKKNAPGAEEVISYGMPAYKFHGMLVYFAAHQYHIGFYPMPSAIRAFEKELAAYPTAKGSVQFPHGKPPPWALIAQMVKFRVQENLEKAQGKKKKPAAAKAMAAATVKAAKTSISTDAEKVEEWLSKLSAAQKAATEAIRKIIKKASPLLQERIKWNAPSYYYKADIVTFGPYKSNKILLVFHHPAVVKITSALLEGDYKDRRLVYFGSKAEAEKHKKELTRILLEIIKAIGG